MQNLCMLFIRAVLTYVNIFKEHKKMAASLEKCSYCFEKVPKHLIISIGKKVGICIMVINYLFLFINIYVNVASVVISHLYA